MDRSVAVRLSLEIAQYKAGLSDASAATDRFASQAESAGKRVQKTEQSKGEAASSSAKTTTQAATTAGAAQDSAASTAESAAGRTEQAAQTTAQAAESSASAQESASGTAQAASEKQASAAESSAKRSEGAFSKIAQSARENQEAWTTAGAALTGFGAAILGIGAAALATGISYNQLQQTSRAALTTLMRSAKDANAQMDKLDEFASTSPFAKDVFIRAQQQMLGFGIEAQKVIPYLDSIQNAVAATGGSNHDIAELSRIFSQISASAKITATDLREFGNRGIDAATLIGSQMGLTGAQIREQITAGTLDAGTALDALAAGMQETYGGAAEGVKETLAGAFDRVKAAWRDLSAELAAPLVGPEGGGLLVGLLNTVADLMRAFQNLPGPVKVVTGVLAGTVGAAALAAGTFLLLTPRIVATKDAFRTLFPVGGRVSTMLSRVGESTQRMMGKIGRVGMGTTLIVGMMHALRGLSDEIRGIDRTVPSVERLTNGLRGAAESGDYYGAVLGHLAEQGAINTRQFGDLESAIKNAADPGAFDRFMAWANLDATGLEDVQESFAGIGEALAAMPLEEAQAQFRAMWEEAGGSEETGQQLLELMPALRERLAQAANEAGIVGEEFDELAAASGELSLEVDGAGDSMGNTAEEAAELAAEQERLEAVTRKTTDEIADQVGQLETLLDVMRNAGSAFMDVQDAQAQYAETMLGLGDVMDEFAQATGDALDSTGENWDFYSDKGALANQTINEMAQNGWDLVDSLTATQAPLDEVSAAMQRTRDDVINQAMAFGMSEEAAGALADSMGLIPENVYSNIDVVTGPGLARLAALEEQMALLPDGEVTVNGDTLPAEDALAEIVETINTTDADHIVINGNIVPVEEALDEIEGLIADGVSDLDVGINRDGAILETTELVSDIEGMAPEIPLLADDTSARETGATFGTWVENLDPTAHIDAESDSAEAQTMWWQTWTNNTTGTAGIDAEDRGADSQLARTLRSIDKATGTTGIDAEDRGAESETRRITRMITGKAGTMGVLAEDRGATGEGRRLARLIDGYGASVNVGAQARWGQINSVIAAIQNRAGSAGASVVIGGVMGRASGGEVWGSGTSTSDSITARLSNGEFVMRTAAANHYGRDFLHAINQMRLPKAALFADGGPVGPTGWGRGGGYVPPPVQSGSTSVVNNYHLQINPGDLQGIRTLEELVANARRTSRQQVGVRG